MTRRDTIRAALAAASGEPLVLLEQLSAAEHRAVHSEAPPEPDRWRDYKPQFFTAAELEMLRQYTEILIPTDESPGASEAHVAEYIDFIVYSASAHAPEMQAEWKKAVAWLAGRNFDRITPAERLALVESMSAPERDKTASHDGFPTYRLIKNMTVFAFYTSRAGLIGNLEYKGLAYLTEFPACTHQEHMR